MTTPPPIGPEQSKRSTAFALVIGFLPSVFALIILGCARGSSGSTTLAGIFLLLCIVSVFCCFASAVLLFRRGTALAILGGILFLILNALIAFGAGCGMILSQMRF